MPNTLYQQLGRVQPKIRTWHSRKYMEFVKRQPSILSGKIRNNAPHHHRKGTNGGIGFKPSDVWCVSVTGQEHSDIHDGFITLDEQEVINWCFNSLKRYLKMDLKEYQRTREELNQLSNYLCEQKIK